MSRYFSGRKCFTCLFIYCYYCQCNKNKLQVKVGSCHTCLKPRCIFTLCDSSRKNIFYVNEDFLPVSSAGLFLFCGFFVCIFIVNISFSTNVSVKAFYATDKTEGESNVKHMAENEANVQKLNKMLKKPCYHCC